MDVYEKNPNEEHHYTPKCIENPRNMKVLHLREELKLRGLSPSGLKSTLVRRLIQAFQEEGYNVDEFLSEDYGNDFSDDEEPSYFLRWEKLPLTLWHNPEECYSVINTGSETSILGRKEIVNVQIERGHFSRSPIKQDSFVSIPSGLINFSTSSFGDYVVIFGGSCKDNFYNHLLLYDISVYLPRLQPLFPNFSPGINIWKKLETFGNIPSPRDSHSATFISENELVIFGGRFIENGKSVSLNDIYLLNFETRKWIELVVDGDLKSRYGHSTTFYPPTKSLYIFGGVRVEPEAGQAIPKKKWLNTIAVINIQTYKHYKLDMNGRFEEPRAYHTASVIKNKLYIIGGYNKVYNCLYAPQYVSVLDLDKAIWSFPSTVGAIPHGRWNHHSLVVNNHIILYGGYIGKNDASENSLFILNTEFEPTVTINQYCLSYDLKQLLQNELFSDVNFRVQNKYLRSHKAILLCRADSLRDLCNKKKKRGQTITIESVKHHVFSYFLRLIYIGKVGVSSKYFKPLEDLVNQYKLDYKVRKVFGKNKFSFTLPSISLKSLINNRTYSDLTFSVLEDNSFYYAHKCIISARSQYFSDVLTNEEDGEAPNNIIVDDVKGKHFTIMLNVIYSGFDSSSQIHAIQSYSEICELLEISSKYRICDMNVVCQKILFEKYLTPETVLSLYNLANITFSEQLKQCCIHLLKREMSNPNSVVIKELSTSDQQSELYEILSNEPEKLLKEDVYVSNFRDNLIFVEHSLKSSKMELE